MQGAYDLARFASTLKTEKTKTLGSQRIFKRKGGHYNIVREVRLHDPVTFSMCLHSDSLLPYNKLLKVKTFFNYHSCIFRFIRWRILCCHFYLGHFTASVYITSTGMCHPLISSATLPRRFGFWLVSERILQAKWEKSWTVVNFFRWEIFRSIPLRTVTAHACDVFRSNFSHFAKLFLTGNWPLDITASYLLHSLLLSGHSVRILKERSCFPE